jgi:hypothetical protein
VHVVLYISLSLYHTSQACIHLALCFAAPLAVAQALANLDKLSTVATVVGLLAAVVAVAKIVAAAPVLPASALTLSALQSALTSIIHLPGLLPAAGLAAACLLLYNKLQQFRHKFIYEDYVHAHRH